MLHVNNNYVSERNSYSCSLDVSEEKELVWWTVEMQADVNRQTHVKSTKSKSQGAQDRDKGERETELKSEKEGRMETEKT